MCDILLILTIEKILEKFTWAKLIGLKDENGFFNYNRRGQQITSSKMERPNICEILYLQELRKININSYNIITRWFLREWNDINWSNMFKKIIPNTNHSSLIECATSYFNELINYSLYFTRWGDSGGNCFKIICDREDGEELEDGEDEGDRKEILIHIFLDSDDIITLENEQCIDGFRERISTLYKNGEKIECYSQEIIAPYSSYFDMCSDYEERDHDPNILLTINDNLIGIIHPKYYNLINRKYKYGD